MVAIVHMLASQSMCPALGTHEAVHHTAAGPVKWAISGDPVDILKTPLPELSESDGSKKPATAPKFGFLQ